MSLQVAASRVAGYGLGRCSRNGGTERQTCNVHFPVLVVVATCCLSEHSTTRKSGSSEALLLSRRSVSEELPSAVVVSWSWRPRRPAAAGGAQRAQHSFIEEYTLNGTI